MANAEESARGTVQGSEARRSADPMISLRGVSKRFRGTSGAAVENLSFNVARGETVVLVGPSGCGKTTTMRMINRLIEPDAGTIEIDGRDIRTEDVDRLRRGIGYVIQTVGLMPHRTVAQNIATVPGLLGWDRARTEARIAELSAMFSLDDELLRRYPADLSGGQRQRVGVARALAADPPVMLMDEPFGAVDPIIRDRLQEQFLDIQRTIKKTIVFVTHDIDEAIRLADRIAIMNVGGVVEQLDTPAEILRAPANEFVVEFVGPERGLRRLGLISVETIDLDPPDGRSGLPHVQRTSSLRAALDAIVSARSEAALIVDAAGAVGVLTLDRISREVTD